MTRSADFVAAGLGRAVLANNESFQRLIVGRGAFLSVCDDRSRYRDSFRSGGSPFFFTLGTRLREC